MATDPRKRQKKLERRAAKRKEKKHLVVREQSGGLPERLSAASRYPVLHCWIPDSQGEQGIGWVVLSRGMPGGQVAVVSFLVDSYCLGVKNVFAEILGRPSYDSKYLRKMTSEMPSRSVAPAEARKFLEEAVAYARGLGLAPHPDYLKGMLLFGDVNAADSTAPFEFGKDGMPYFVAGPHDTPERCRQILAILANTCGPGRFHYLIPAAGPDLVRVLPDALRQGDVRLIGPDESGEIIDHPVHFGEEEE
jgi:hypothetical protein